MTMTMTLVMEDCAKRHSFDEGSNDVSSVESD